jgi:hypothetical protein
MKSKLLVVFTIILFSITGCEYFENGTTLNVNTFQANITGLPALPDSMTYVGWFEREKDNTKYYVKVFVEDAGTDGNISYKSEKDLKSLQEAQQFWLTTEKKLLAADSVKVPSSRIILAGTFRDASSSLFISQQQSSISTARAVFSIETPTDGDSTNELSGVWFADSVSTNPVAGLNLPALYGGWIYEGWVEINGQYLSTGRFSDPSAKDLFSGYSDVTSGYNLPGEDFLLNAPSGFTFPLNLSNAKVAVSIEYNDGRTFGDQPYIKIFEATVSASPQSKVSYNLQYTNPVFASGNSYMVVDLVK